MNIGTNAPSFPIGEFSNTPTIAHTKLDPPLTPASSNLSRRAISNRRPSPNAVVNVVREFHAVQPGFPQLASI